VLVTQVQVLERFLQLAFEKGQDDLGEEPEVPQLQEEVELVAEVLEGHLALLLLGVGAPFENLWGQVSVGTLAAVRALSLSDGVENGLDSFEVTYYLHLGAVDVLNQMLVTGLSSKGQEGAALCEGLLAV
jgi:hypothetical protein